MWSRAVPRNLRGSTTCAKTPPKTFYQMIGFRLVTKASVAALPPRFVDGTFGPDVDLKQETIAHVDLLT